MNAVKASGMVHNYPDLDVRESFVAKENELLLSDNEDSVTRDSK